MTRDTDHIELTDPQMRAVEDATHCANVEALRSGIKDLDWQDVSRRVYKRRTEYGDRRIARHEALKALEALEWDIARVEAMRDGHAEYLARARGARRRIGRALDNLESRELEGV